MTKPKFFTDKFIASALRFIIFFAMVGITPLFGKLLAPLLDFLGRTLLRELFAEVFTIILWGIEGLIFHFVNKKLTKGERPSHTLVVSADEYEYEHVDEIPVFTVKKKKPLLPWKNVGILTAICVGCVLLVGAIIGFQVKPFYDFGEKFTGYELGCALGRLVRNIVKCLFIMYMLPECKSMAEEVAKTCFPKKKAWATWLLTGGILLLFGVFDIFAFVLRYPLNGREVLLGLAYFIFYGAFTAVYYFTNENAVKSYWLIMLIYIF